jgi:Transglutaminase-like superfamily
VRRALWMLPAHRGCLARSLVLVDLLQRRGVAATLVIGARADPTFRAHAWVEVAGEPLLSPGDYRGGRLAEL